MEGLGVTRFWRDRSVLLSGATGLLGGWLAGHLLQRGAQVAAVARDWAPQSEWIRKGLIEKVNFSTETPITVLDLVGKIPETMGSNLQPEVRNEVSCEIREQFLSAQRARQQGWIPQFTLDEGLKRSIAWYTELLNQ